MSINLEKNDAVSIIDLGKESSGSGALSRVIAKMSWADGEYDLDVSAFLCNNASGAPLLESNQHFVFYNNTAAPAGTVIHSGDNLTGGSQAGVDGEEMTIDFANLDNEGKVDQIDLIVTIHDADSRQHNFGQVDNAVIALIDAETGDELASYSLNEDFSTSTAVHVGTFDKDTTNTWEFVAKGDGFDNSLNDFVGVYQA